MSRILQHKTSFTAGELSPELFGRDDLRAYENGAARLRNVVVRPTGGVSRRPGLRHVAEVPGPARLIPFDFDAQQVYLVVVSHGLIQVFLPGEAQPDATLGSPFLSAHLDGMTWTQSADTLLLAHPLVQPQKLVRRAGAVWQLGPLAFASGPQEGGPSLRRVPYARFGDPALRLTASDTSGTVVLTATHDLFVAEHLGARFELKGRQVEIVAVDTPQRASALCLEELADTEETGDWCEEAVSSLRGWPVSLVFHKDRLVIGGTRDLPNHLFLSRAGELFDFDSDEGQDDAAIDFPLMGDRVNGIRAVASGRHLQVFTSGGEWIVTGEPLTPATVEAIPQTAIGSPATRHIRPVVVDGATLFVGPTRDGLYEFLYTDLEQAYSALDLTLLARHLVPDIRAIAYEPRRRLLHAVTAEGTLACLTQYRAEQITAWTLCATSGGAIRDIAVPGGMVFLLVARPGGLAIEQMDPGLQLDAALEGESPEPASVWSGLDHLEGEAVAVLADGCPRGHTTVEGGAVTLDRPASRVVVGKTFRHEIVPLPPVVRNAKGRDPAAAIRLVETTLRLRETAQLQIDLGRGLEPVPLARLADPLLDAPPIRVSGDRRLSAAGWRRGDTAPLWRLEGEEPLPLTLLSVTNQLKVND